MENELKAEYHKCLNLITKNRSFEILSTGEAFAESEKLIGYYAYFMPHKVTAEVNYFQKIVKNQEGEISNAQATALAKTSQEYKDYLLLTGIMKICDEQIRVLKKFKTDLTNEYQQN